MKNTVLLVIDFINDIVNPQGKIAASAAFVQENNVIENANHAITFARQNKIMVAFVKVGFSAHYLECPENSPLFGRAKQFGALQLNTWGTEFHEKLAIQPQDFVIVKHRVSAFYATSLEPLLRANAIQQILLCGVSTDMAIQTTAREAHDRDYAVTIIEDACGAGSAELHSSALKLLQRIANITSVKALNKSILE